MSLLSECMIFAFVAAGRDSNGAFLFLKSPVKESAPESYSYLILQVAMHAHLH